MALIKCPECGKEISDSVKTCPHCGYKLSKVKKSGDTDKTKRIAILTSVIIFILIIIGMIYYFFSPRTFEWCCYHHINDATCTEAETCSRCGKTWGEPKGHSWKNATCTEPRTCEVCGKTEGEANGHNWESATCTTSKTCKICGATEGDVKPHSWIRATCTSPSICKYCHKVSGNPLGHNIEDYICTRCGKVFVKESDVPDILDITSIRYEINYVGGIDQYLTFVNKSSTKTINYINIKLAFINSVGDVLQDEISGEYSVTLQYTGPLKPGKTSENTYWRACFYNSTFAGVCDIKEIQIEYSDGTTLVLDDDIADYAVKSWR